MTQDPNEVAASARAEQAELYGTVEFAEWQEIVKLYAGHGRDMHEAVAMADMYIRVRRKRSPWKNT